MEIRNKNMIVLTEKGEFIRAKTKANVGIGEEVSFSPIPLYQFSTFFERKIYSVPIASALALLLIFPISSLFQTSTVYGVVSLDMNPSIELAVNDHYEIVSTVGYNEKGKSLLKNIENSLEGMTFLNAASELLQEGYDQGMIGDTNAIYFSSALSFYDELNLESWSISISDEYNFDVYSILVEEPLAKEAQELSISPAKLLLQSNVESDKFDSLELSNTPMQEIEQNFGQSFDDMTNVESVLDISKNKDDYKEELEDTSKDDSSSNEVRKAELEPENSESDGNKDEKKDAPLNPSGKKSHPHKQEHPGKGNVDEKDQKLNKNTKDNKDNKENKSNNGKKNSSNGEVGEANGKEKEKGKPTHAGGKKSN
ncbi:anti-sigma factor domain-containing protein [Salipaludibacillus sp. HK11]|uniref:anti-sigma factor domain-containing protein n=1 Tax=Salipaludibacillus sp. HK11 TaxID=3394320 RepID=UPI0039FD6AA6